MLKHTLYYYISFVSISLISSMMSFDFDFDCSNEISYTFSLFVIGYRIFFLVIGYHQ